MTPIQSSRRRFLQQAALVVVAAPLASLVPVGDAFAKAPRLPLTNAQAKALGYKPSAATVTAKSLKPGSNCANCQFFTAKTEACTIFPGFSVEPKGWCTAWALRKP